MTVDFYDYVIAFHIQKRFGLVGIGQWGLERSRTVSRKEGESVKVN
jgi:hypothetical protein